MDGRSNGNRGRGTGRERREAKATVGVRVIHTHTHTDGCCTSTNKLTVSLAQNPPRRNAIKSVRREVGAYNWDMHSNLWKQIVDAEPHDDVVPAHEVVATEEEHEVDENDEASDCSSASGHASFWHRTPTEMSTSATHHNVVGNPRGIGVTTEDEKKLVWIGPHGPTDTWDSEDEFEDDFPTIPEATITYQRSEARASIAGTEKNVRIHNVHVPGRFNEPRTRVCKRSCLTNGCNCSSTAEVLWRGHEMPVEVVEPADLNESHKTTRSSVTCDGPQQGRVASRCRPTVQQACDIGARNDTTNGSVEHGCIGTDDGSPGALKDQDVTRRTPIPKPAAASSAKLEV